MPGEHHEILINLLRSWPQTLGALLRERGVPVPEVASVQALDPDATQLRPVVFDTDLILRFAHETERVTVIVEVQRAIDDEKLRTWPLYFAHLRTQVSSRVVLAVVATTRQVAAWARRPIVDEDGELLFTPRVFGPDDVPGVVPARPGGHCALL